MAVEAGTHQLHLLHSLCSPCPRAEWCARTLERLCLLPSNGEADRHWSYVRERVASLRGVGPRALPPLRTVPNLPIILHTHASSPAGGRTDYSEALGVRGSDVLDSRRNNFCINASYLERENLLASPKVLLLSAQDKWLNRFLQNLGEAFFTSLAASNFAAVFSPALSAYHHAEHRVWLENRAIGQNFLSVCLEREIPAIFLTYLEDHRLHTKWLVDFLKLNPTQAHIATAFDRGGANNFKFVERRLRLLHEVEHRVGRPLRVVLLDVVTRIRAIELASGLFPGRVHLAGGSLFMRSVKGSRLAKNLQGDLYWVKRAKGVSRGWELFNENKRFLAEYLRTRVPSLFEAAAPSGGASSSSRGRCKAA